MSDYTLEKLLHSKKYRDICPDTVARVWDECSRKYKKPREIDRAAREALHGISGAFLTSGDAVACARSLEAWNAGGRTDALMEAVLARHTSTRERLPLHRMDALYSRIFGYTGKTDHVLDLACGVHPLYLGMRGLKATGVDISGRAVGLINDAASAYGLPIEALLGDLLCAGAIPRRRYDAALLFKALPLLERQRAGAAGDVLRSVDAGIIAVSFPTRTLGGRDVGMAAHYADWMRRHLPETLSVCDSFESADELFYILKGN